ncbi:MAG: hypothetical protein K8F91_24015, partial [Candidatus Obscuribacterales bacterium]|nr:hypothetical protein [Candidatus Obscuribacterales bacterium]
MDKRFLAALIAVLPIVTAQAAIAKDMQTPFNVPATLAVPVEYFPSSAGEKLTAIDPQTSQTQAPGIDIVNESLKYHSVVDPRFANTPQFQTPILNATQNSMLTGNTSFNNMMPSYQNQALSAPANMQPNMQQNLQMPVAQTAMTGQMQMIPVMQTGFMPTPTIQFDSTKRMIGMLGATTLMGAFVQNGGVGGIMKSIGWDNN